MKSNLKKLKSLLIVLATLLLVACLVDKEKLEEANLNDDKNISEMLCETQDGDSLKLGEAAPSDDCNACVCGEGGEIVCDLAVCEEPSQAVCTDGDGNFVKAGDSFAKDCNTCYCDENGNAACTEIACVTKPETICHDCDVSHLNVGCQGDDSVIVAPGDSLIHDGLSCICGQSGMLSCSVTILKETGEGCYSFIDSLSQRTYNRLTEEESLVTTGYKVDDVFCDLEEPRFCTTEYAPVCALTKTNELKTFSNRCEADVANAVFDSEGVCEIFGVIEGKICPESYIPTSDGECEHFVADSLYNHCEADIVGATFNGEGECPEIIFDPIVDSIPEVWDCARTFNPDACIDGVKL